MCRPKSILEKYVRPVVKTSNRYSTSFFGRFFIQKAVQIEKVVSQYDVDDTITFPTTGMITNGSFETGDPGRRQKKAEMMYSPLLRQQMKATAQRGLQTVHMP